MAITIGDLVDAALSEVYGHTQLIDAESYLLADVTADALTLTVASAAEFSRGIVQVGDELLMVDTVDRDNGILGLGSVACRGIRGTTAAAHSLGDRVTMSPSIPRSAGVRAVEETLRASSGLFAVGSTTLTYQAGTMGYAIPATARTVLSVSWWPPTGDAWQPIRRWTHDKISNLLVIAEAIIPLSSVKVTYATTPTVPTQGQDFSVTGLPDSCIDVIRLGAAWRLVNFLEPASLLSQGAEPDVMKRQQQGGLRVRVGQYLFQAYRARLEEEVRDLQDRYPISVHWRA